MKSEGAVALLAAFLLAAFCMYSVSSVVFSRGTEDAIAVYDLGARQAPILAVFQLVACVDR